MSDSPNSPPPESLPDGARQAAIAALAAEIDLADSTTILRFGAAIQARAQEAADAMLEGARSSEAGEAGRSLSAMLEALRGFDVTRAGDRPGLLSRLFRRARGEVQGILSRYETLRGQIEAIGDRLDAHRTRLLEDVERLDRLYEATLEWFHALTDHIAAGELALARFEAEKLPILVAAAEDPADPLAPQRLRDARAARDELERRIHDLKLTRQVAMQALPAIRLIQENNKALAARIHSVLANTVPLWRQQLAQALAIQRMREAGQAVKAATDLTGELLTANAETLRRGSAEARTELERGAVDLAAVQRAHAALIGTIEDSLRIAEQSRSRRLQAAEALSACEAEIRRALTAARAQERAPGRA
ncbi:MAG: toxic anion resistance protein [Rhodovarius sp.]|nr:toxic anion resistance protein [Rhodovarius sp.]MDW8314560.1 toxic anion resistance protein [Rhodovarius sp.]